MKARPELGHEEKRKREEFALRPQKNGISNCGQNKWTKMVSPKILFSDPIYNFHGHNSIT